MTAPVYKDGVQVAVRERAELREIISSLKGLIPDDLYTKLSESMYRVNEVCDPSVVITKCGYPIGKGLNKSQKAIACDQMSAIIKQIKSLKAWG